MPAIRIDPHAHLYDAYPTRSWCAAAMRNLGGGSNAEKMLVVVDRKGQDSFERLSREVPQFGTWVLLEGEDAGIVSVDGQSFTVVRGVQYVAQERIEVLGLGIRRTVDDLLPASELVAEVIAQGGIACLPWSPGKWLGKRGGVVQDLLRSFNATQLALGDIAIRSRVGPYSSILSSAANRGYRVLCGTDPLPSVRDAELVGTFGVELSGELSIDSSEGVRRAVRALLDPAQVVGSFGRRNSPIQAGMRFATQYF